MSFAEFADGVGHLGWPEGLGVAASEPVDPAALFDVEAAAVARAVPARQAEFAGGRTAAREAMGQIGRQAAPVLMRQDRSPVWPAGVVGSISHSEDVCLAVAGHAHLYRSLGVDLEPLQPMESALVEEVTRADEVSDGDLLLQTRRRFSAKEAVFKTIYPIIGVTFGFQAMHVDLSAGVARLAEHPETEILPQRWQGRVMPFRQFECAGMIVSFCALPYSRADVIA